MDFTRFKSAQLVFVLTVATIFTIMIPSPSDAADAAAPSSFYQLSAKSINGEMVPLSNYEGYVILVVNTASKCGFTSQYHDLEEIYDKYKDQKFTVLGFPSNDFLNQEPGSDEEVKTFCTSKFGVSFPLFSKDSVTGSAKQPVYQFLTERSGDAYSGEIKWNFEKFLIDRGGNVRGRFGSFTNPSGARLVGDIEKLLKE